MSRTETIERLRKDYRNRARQQEARQRLGLPLPGQADLPSTPIAEPTDGLPDDEEGVGEEDEPAEGEGIEEEAEVPAEVRHD